MVGAGREALQESDGTVGRVVVELGEEFVIKGADGVFEFTDGLLQFGFEGIECEVYVGVCVDIRLDAFEVPLQLQA